jgi:hypothetical protein
MTYFAVATSKRGATSELASILLWNTAQDAGDAVWRVHSGDKYLMIPTALHIGAIQHLAPS